jgi:hypothetical protein
MYKYRTIVIVRSAFDLDLSLPADRTATQISYLNPLFGKQTDIFPVLGKNVSTLRKKELGLIKYFVNQAGVRGV